MTNRQARENQQAAMAAMIEHHSSGDSAFYVAYWAVAWGDENGSFADKYGDSADDEIDWRAHATDLSNEWEEWSMRSESAYE